MTKHRLFVIVSIVGFLLLLPAIAMQFTDEVNWDITDFGMASFLLFTTGIALDWINRSLSLSKHRLAFSLAIIIVFLLIWAELAVGLFD